MVCRNPALASSMSRISAWCSWRWWVRLRALCIPSGPDLYTALKPQIGETAFIVVLQPGIKSFRRPSKGSSCSFCCCEVCCSPGEWPTSGKAQRERGAGNQVRKNSNSNSVIWAKRARQTLTATMEQIYKNKLSLYSRDGISGGLIQV